ncbi:c-type cytochrome [Marinomonas sp. 15G1-11]|uniref:C-type cytochrome n=1 Tax=Marinomonas phaeophyticola TaxID=3004091 RepID=A0ABT4JR64_9GAMM|nr:cytochrome c peroxidase [Marinomonas sp. 15G1-11]MCZ2720878.1 c-type cytochrome [Marinomonas sp. 15G1-11]
MIKYIVALIVIPIFSVHAREEFAITPISYPDISKKIDQVMLGKSLFNDPILFDNGKSCAGCHLFSYGGAFPSALGAPEQARKINVPTVFNTSLNFRWHWDGEYKSLEEHVDNTIKIESSSYDTAWELLLQRLEDNVNYKKRFKQTYGEISKKHVLNSIVEYEKALIAPSLFDDHLKGSRKLSADALRGFHKFQRYGCISCHQGKNIGGNIIVPIGVINNFFATKKPLTQIDYGHYNVTGKERHKFYFKVPSLRNVARTAPYFHDGSAESLEKAVTMMAFYQLGLALDTKDVADIVSFLESLSGDPLTELME